MRPRVPYLLGRSIDRFASKPASVRNAAWLMIGVTVSILLIGGLVVWVFDSNDYPDYGSALWYALQTVTTVGYGDNVPTNAIGRIVGALVMVVAIALISIVTASITSTFVEAAQRRHRDGQEAKDRDAAKAVDERLDEIVSRLSSIERSIQALELGRGSEPSVSPRPPDG